MFLKHLELKNFRNYEDINLDLNCGLILFLGSNGAGKTNLLESIYYLSNGRSHRSATQSDLINHGSDYCVIRGVIESEGEDKLIEIQLNSDNSIKIKLNKVFIKNKSGFTSKLATVIFSPDDLRIIKSSPFYRRNFLDDIIEKIDKDYIGLRLKYQKILNQRNTLIKSIYGTNISSSNSTLEIWDEKLVETGALIIKKRLDLLNLVKTRFANYMNYFFKNTQPELMYVFSWQRFDSNSVFLNDYSGKENTNTNHEIIKQSDNNYNIGKYTDCDNSSNNYSENHSGGLLQENTFESGGDITDKTNVDIVDFNMLKNSFDEKLRYYFKKDCILKTTTIGPHRDDLTIFLNGYDIRNFGSQGQQRIAAICLKLTELDIFVKNIDEKPMLLLDDVLSELDLERKHLLLKLIGNNFQTFISAANFDYLKDMDLKYCEKYLVKDNGIKKY
ncbi:MAG: DNA replication/repair protein RecF [Candidatus Humimicrobiaceae bacterium]